MVPASERLATRGLRIGVVVAIPAWLLTVGTVPVATDAARESQADPVVVEVEMVALHGVLGQTS